MKHRRIHQHLRKNKANGILYRGWTYECCTPLLDPDEDRILVVEDNDDHLIVSRFKFESPLSTICNPTGQAYRVNRIAPGRPTTDRISKLKDAVNQQNKLLRSNS